MRFYCYYDQQSSLLEFFFPLTPWSGSAGWQLNIGTCGRFQRTELKQQRRKSQTASSLAIASFYTFAFSRRIQHNRQGRRLMRSCRDSSTCNLEVKGTRRPRQHNQRKLNQPTRDIRWRRSVRLTILLSSALSLHIYPSVWEREMILYWYAQGQAETGAKKGSGKMILTIAAFHRSGQCAQSWTVGLKPQRIN